MTPHDRRALFPAKGAPDDTALSWLERRPALRQDLWEESRAYLPDEGIVTSLELALSLGAPLLVTGEPGSGKTELAYFAARRLGLDPPLHFQARSTSEAQGLKYTFDTIAYFRAAHLGREGGGDSRSKEDYITRGPLWEALDTHKPRVLLIDEIDKAPRDFPNDLLHELDQMAFRVPELDVGSGRRVVERVVRLPDPRLRPLVVITSNSEHRLPEAFLRRCVYHHIVLDRARMKQILTHRREGLGRPSDRLIEVAITRFYELKDRVRRKAPSTAELLAWIRLLAGWSGMDVRELEEMPVERLPFLGVLLKTREDLEAVGVIQEEPPSR